MSTQPDPKDWTPCMKLPVVVHVRQQRPGEAHVSTREGLTPVKPDDLIMRGVSGEEYPIGRAIFEQTYTLDTTPPAAPAQCEWCNGRGVLAGHAQDGSFDGEDCPHCTPPAQPASVRGFIKKIEDLIQERDDARSSRDFYKRRADALQQWQSKMRDPERTIVCDILANGCTLEPAGDRYTAPPAQTAPVHEPIYQMQMMDGKWIDQAKQSYEYNKAHGHTVRIVYTTPPAAPAQSCYCPNCEALTKEIAALKAQPAPVQPVAWREALERIADPRNTHFAGDAQVVARDALATPPAAQPGVKEG